MQYKLEDFHYTIKDMIGQGANADVYMCRLINDPSKEFVIKIVNYKVHDNEILILNKLVESSQNNDNIVKTYLIEQYNNQLHIVMEYCQSDLDKVIKNRAQPFTIEESLNIIKQICNGYKVCLQNKIIHRDLKPANILIKDNTIFKLADFGEGKIFQDTNQFKNQTRVGTPAFCAPQILEATSNKAIATNKLDIYSLGMMFYQMLTKSLPFKTLDQQGIIQFLSDLKNEKFKVKERIPNLRDDVAELLESMLKYKEEDRIDWNGLINHRLFNQSPTKKIIQIIPTQTSFLRTTLNMQLSVPEQNQILEIFEQRRNEIIYVPEFEKIPTNQGYEKFRNHIMQHKNNLIPILPYQYDRKYSIEYLKIIFLFNKIIRNDAINFKLLDDINAMREYLQKIKNI